jgi:hypothetical protein
MQAETAPADGAETTASVETPATPPLVSGAPALLWSGVVAIAVIFILTLVLIGRWRVNRRAREGLRNTEFFQPAGEGAEITFDEVEAAATAGSELAAVPFEPAPDTVVEEPVPEKKKRGFSFGSLFKKREKPVGEAVASREIADDVVVEEAGLASVRIERPERSVFSAGGVREPEATSRIPDWATIEREDRLRAEREEHDRAAREHEAEDADRRRRQLEEESRHRAEEDDRRRAAEQQALARFEEMDRRAATELRAIERPALSDDIVRTLSEVEEALHAQREAIQSETRALLDNFARRFGDRLDLLAQSVERRAPTRTDPGAGPAPGGADFAAIADLVSRRLDDHREHVAGAIGAISKRLDSLGGASTNETAALREEIREFRRSLGAQGESAAPAVQLSDIVRDALPPSAYEFNATIANGRRADCLVRLPFPPGPIAIDAKFPLEAFHALHRAKADAENEFRRVALRHIVDIAERLIAPGVTADSAMMFVPSESLHSEIHARFPEVVQDSYRARVWIVSPTSLMATLHTMSGVLRDATLRSGAFSGHNDAQRVLAEVDRLRERVATLEHALAGNAGNPLDALAARESGKRAEQPYEASSAVDSDRGFRRLHKGADNDAEPPVGDLYAEDPSASEEIVESGTARPARPPFPLR